MDLYLSNISALECWRYVPSLRSRAVARRRPVRDLPNETGCPSARQIKELRTHGFEFLSMPVHVSVGRAGDRSCHKLAVGHVCTSSLPADAFVECAEGVFVASPMLLLVQLAPSLARPKLMERCFELCGRYRLVPESPKGFVSADPLIDIDEMLGWVDQLEKVRGKAVAKRALRYVLPNAESPMEAVLAMLLCLPTRFGGYGLPAPVLNHRIDMTGCVRMMTDKSHVRCDLCWPDAKLVVEYDSDWAHSGSDHIAADASRRAALIYADMQVVTVTRKQIMSVIEMDRIATLLARQLGVSLRTRKPDCWQARMELRSRLLDFSDRSRLGGIP